MRTHDLDPWSLVFGVAFLSVAGSYLLTHTTSVHLHWLLIVPAAMILLGAVLLGGSAVRMRRKSDLGSEIDDDGGVV
ncbi:MAG TPA: hypothetical protein VHW74_05715 [Mycobacteriales bacterium]|jgi:hypothetical protein|nr:hypothetical protein [Mycobacteriales bacterium]